MIRPLLRSICLCLALGAVAAPGVAAAEAPRVVVTPVTSPGGITAWLWRDDTVPVLTLRAAARGGARLDPKPGVSRLMNALTGTTAGNDDPITFARRFETLSASLSVSRGSAFDQISVRMLREAREDSADLVARALTAPVVPPDALELARGTLVRQLTAEQRQPGARAEAVLAALILGDAAPMVTTRPGPAAVAAIGAADLDAVHRSRLTRANLAVSVAGAIDPAELGPLLDRLFGGLPAGTPAPPPPAFPDRPAPGFYHVPVAEAPQSVVVTVLPGLTRTDPDYWPAVILNHVFGGATFTSRLKQDLRETRGMVYSTDAYLYSSGLRPTWRATAAMAPGRAAEAAAVMRRLWDDLHANGITQEELDAARDYFLGSAVVGLTSTAAMADFVLGLQLDGLPPTYYDDRRAILAGLTLDRVNDVARRRIDPSALITIVAGQAAPDLPPSLPLPPGF